MPIESAVLLELTTTQKKNSCQYIRRNLIKFENINISRRSKQNDFYYTWVPGFSNIGRTREGPRFSITFALYVKKIFIGRVCKCATLNVFTMCRKKIYASVCEAMYVKKSKKYTFYTIKSWYFLFFILLNLF